MVEHCSILPADDRGSMEIIFKDLTDIQLDALKEVTHIGAASAVTALPNSLIRP